MYLGRHVSKTFQVSSFRSGAWLSPANAPASFEVTYIPFYVPFVSNRAHHQQNDAAQKWQTRWPGCSHVLPGFGISIEIDLATMLAQTETTKVFESFKGAVAGKRTDVDIKHALTNSSFFRSVKSMKALAPSRVSGAPSSPPGTLSMVS